MIRKTRQRACVPSKHRPGCSGSGRVPSSPPALWRPWPWAQASRGHFVPLPGPASSDFVVIYRQSSGLLSWSSDLISPKSICQGKGAETAERLQPGILSPHPGTPNTACVRRSGNVHWSWNPLFSHHPTWQEQAARWPGSCVENTVP